METQVMKKLLILLSLALLAGPSASRAAQPGTPDEEATASAAIVDDATAAKAVVERLHDVLLGCMREGDSLGFQGRYDRIAPTLHLTFDLPFMARLSLGADWKELDEEQRADFISLSRRLSASNYADNFSSYGGESFETHSVEPAAHSTMLVKTELILPREKNVEFDYRLRKVAAQWRIIDVQLDGKVSEITLRRADYRSMIQREGFSKLVARIEEKIEKLSKE
jgi:phospholipid transport system substrate-binding protein